MPHSQSASPESSLPADLCPYCSSLHCPTLDTAATPLWLNCFVSGGHLLLCSWPRVLPASTLRFNFVISLFQCAVQTGLSVPSVGITVVLHPALLDQTQSL